MGGEFEFLLHSVGLSLGILAALEVGRRVGRRQLRKDAERTRPGTAAVEGVVFALLGLLVAFTFSGAASRFDQRRHLITDEANAIGTAWLRIDTLPADAQPAIRDGFRSYLDARLSAYAKLPDADAALAQLEVAKAARGEIWANAVAACATPEGRPVAVLVLPALNQMFDIADVRTAWALTHPPAVIFGMLFGLAVLAAFLAGIGMAGGAKRSWVHVIGLAVTLAGAVYVIQDLEYPRLGLIRVDSRDAMLHEVRDSMR